MYKSKPILFACLFSFCAAAIQGQTEEQIDFKDSLLYALKHTEDETQILGIYGDLIGEYYLIDYDSCLYYAEMTFELAKTLQDSTWWCESQVYLGEKYLYSEQYDLAIAYLREAKNMAQKIDNLFAVQSSLSSLATLHEMIGDSARAKTIKFELTQVSRKNQKYRWLDIHLYNYVVILINEQKHDSASYYIEEMKKLETDHNLDPTYMQLMGYTFGDQNQYDSAIFYMEKSIDIGLIYQEMELASTYSYLAELNQGKGDLKAALKNILKSEEYCLKNNLSKSYTMLLGQKTNILSELNRFDQAILTAQKADSMKDASLSSSAVLDKLQTAESNELETKIHLQELDALREQKNKKAFFIVFVLILSILALAAFFIYKLLKRLSKKKNTLTINRNLISKQLEHMESSISYTKRLQKAYTGNIKAQLPQGWQLTDYASERSEISSHLFWFCKTQDTFSVVYFDSGLNGVPGALTSACVFGMLDEKRQQLATKTAEEIGEFVLKAISDTCPSQVLNGRETVVVFLAQQTDPIPSTFCHRTVLETAPSDHLYDFRLNDSATTPRMLFSIQTKLLHTQPAARI